MIASQTKKPVVFIGAAGQMCRIAIERFAVASNAPLVLSDIKTSVLESLVSKLPEGRATIAKIDLFDRPSLTKAIQGAALVVLGAGPYTKTSEPVLTACLEAKVPYLDFDDDVESTQAALGLFDKAKEAGVPCYIGCGISPGLSNVLAMDVAKELDSVDTIDLCWLVGDERPDIGKAVLEHLLHIAAGPCLTWTNGKPTVTESWVETGYAPMISGSGETLLHETAHPEPVTLPRLFPNATRIRCLGGLGPQPVNGIARGLGKAVRRGAISMEDAVGFMYELATTPPSTAGLGQSVTALKQSFRGGNITFNELFTLAGYATQALEPWRHALMGMLETIWTGECTTGEVASTLISAARGQPEVNLCGLLVRAVGIKNGTPTVVTKRLPKTGPDSYLLKNMGTMTGTSCAAFMVVALESAGERSGVFCPEDWAEPAVFYKALEKVGTPSDELPELL